ncbi:MAG: metal-binding protein [Acidobacteriota bacterium]
MPSGRTHDKITIFLTLPIAAATYYFTRDWLLTTIVTVGLLFGGLMFGPDLDTQSVHYTRWGPLRFIWWPYKVAFSHRSRFSHGILFGTIIRIIYFLLVVTILVALTLYARDWYNQENTRSVAQVHDAFTRVLEIIKPIKREYLLAAFAGLWIGAASHTASDVLGSFFKSVKKSL